MIVANLLAAAEEKAPPLIDVDGTVFIQFALFLIMFFVLSKFVFGPYLRLREDRDKGIKGAKHEAHEMESKARKIVEDYDAQLLKARQRGAEERARLRSEGAVRERQLLGAARDESNRARESARATVATQTQAARTRLSAEADVLAKQMAKKVLGREVA